MPLGPWTTHMAGVASTVSGAVDGLAVVAAGVSFASPSDAAVRSTGAPANAGEVAAILAANNPIAKMRMPRAPSQRAQNGRTAVKIDLNRYFKMSG